MTATESAVAAPGIDPETLAIREVRLAPVAATLIREIEAPLEHPRDQATKVAFRIGEANERLASELHSNNQSSGQHYVARAETQQKLRQ